MTRWARIGILLTVSILLGASTAPAAKWTFMVYLDADNNLEPAGIGDFLEMATVGSNEDVHILVQMDRIPGFTDAYGDWTGCKRYRVTQGMTPTAATALQDLGEVNMGDPATLVDFINWGTANYPADRYAVILWDHGNGWQKRTLSRDPAFKAVCSDDSNGHDRLYNREIRQALNAANPIHLIGFDACLMGMVEVAYELRDAGPSVMVASEELEPGDGWPYDTILSYLTDHPEWSGAELGYAIVELYYASYDAGTQNRTQSVIDLTKTGPLAESISEFADAIRNSWETDRAAVVTEARSVMDRIDLAVIHEKHGDNHRGANGLAIYFPLNEYDYSIGYTGTTIQFPGDTLWDEFLDAYFTDMSGSWIESARKLSVEFQKEYGGGHVDLYHFCSLLAGGIQSDPGYTVHEESYTFEDIAATGTRLEVGDEGHGFIQPGFTFRFYGEDYSGFGVSDNGTIYFRNVDYGEKAYINEPVPGSTDWGERFIAVYWDDLDPDAGGDIFYRVSGSGADRHLTIQWKDVYHYGGGISGVTFQALLYSDGRVRCRYQDLIFGAEEINHGNSATVGLQGSRTQGLEYLYNAPDITGGTALLFTPETTTTCDYALSSDARSFSSDGGKGSVTVSTAATCGWSATKDVGWITIDDGSSGAGGGTISYTVLSNPDIVPRTGQITVGDAAASVTHTITQASACRYTVDPTEADIPAEGAGGTVAIDASGTTCGWTASASHSWIAITQGDTGTGDGSFRYAVEANPGDTTRQGTIQAAGKTVTLTQAGTPVISPVALTNGEDARDLVQDKNGSLYFKIDVPSNASDLQVHTTGGTGNCDLFVRYGQPPEDDVYNASSTTSGNDETVVIDNPQAGTWFIRLIATQYFSDVSVVATYGVTPCTYALGTARFSFTAGGGSGSVAVDVDGTDCAWSASNPHDWITIESSNSGAGDGQIDFTVSPNLQSTEREGALTIVDQTLTITQAGAATSSATQLTNGVAVNLPDEAPDNAQYFVIDVPADQTSLTVTMRGDGDADLYVRRGEEPTLEDYDYAPYLVGSDEGVLVSDPSAGMWYIMVYAFEGFSNLELTARYDRADPIPLTSGEPVPDIAGEEGSLAYYRITVPEGTASLVTETVAASNVGDDVDLYVRYGELPTIYDYDAESAFVTGNENVYIDAPQAGDWFILVYGYTDYSGLTLQATYSECGFDLSLSPETFGADGGSGRITIDATLQTCDWHVEGKSSWITHDPDTVSGTGDGFVDFTVDPNGEATARNGLLIVANQQVTVTQFGQGADDAIQLQNRGTREPLSGDMDSQAYYRIDVPDGQRRLAVNTWSGAGDCDIFLRHDSLPTPSQFDGASTLAGTAENIVLENPESGTWYILVYGYTPYSDAALMATYTHCEIVLSPSSELFTSGNGNGRIDVSPSSETCEWTAFSTVPWAVIDADDKAGAGTGSIGYTVSAHTGENVRSGAIRVMGQSVAIEQLSTDFREPTPLANGDVYTYNPANPDEFEYFVTTVAEGQRLRVETFGGPDTGDCDLYARRDNLPTAEVFDVRSQGPATDECIDIAAPAAGTWYILIRFNTVSDGVSLIGAVITKLSNGIPAPDLGGSAAQWPVMAIDVPVDRETLTFTTSSGTGLANLYIRRGALPNAYEDIYDYTSFLDNTVPVDRPQEGTWFVLLASDREFDGITLTAEYSGGAPLADLGGVVAILQVLCGVSPTAEAPNPLADDRIDLLDAILGLQQIAGVRTIGRAIQPAAAPLKVKTKPAPDPKIHRPAPIFLDR